MCTVIHVVDDDDVAVAAAGDDDVTTVFTIGTISISVILPPLYCEIA